MNLNWFVSRVYLFYTYPVDPFLYLLLSFWAFYYFFDFTFCLFGCVFLLFCVMLVSNIGGGAAGGGSSNIYLLFLHSHFGFHYFKTNRKIVVSSFAANTN